MYILYIYIVYLCYIEREREILYCMYIYCISILYISIIYTYIYIYIVLYCIVLYIYCISMLYREREVGQVATAPPVSPRFHGITQTMGLVNRRDVHLHLLSTWSVWWERPSPLPPCPLPRAYTSQVLLLLVDTPPEVGPATDVHTGDRCDSRCAILHPYSLSLFSFRSRFP
jgi:hypothetical protein